MGEKSDIGNLLVDEVTKLQTLVLLGANRSGSPGNWTSTSSSTLYTYTDEDDLLSQLQTVLEDTLITAADYNGLLNSTLTYTTSSGSANAYVLTTTSQLTQYDTGQTYSFKANFSNTGASTINVDTIGIKNIKKFLTSGISDLSTGDIIQDGIYIIKYDGTQFLLLNPSCINSSIFTAAGSFIYSSAAQTPSEFTNGTSRQTIRMNSAGTLPEWISGIDVPGQVITYAANSAPTGFLKCNGAAISRTTYSDLFSAISTTFGVGDGSTTFNLPDLRGEFIRGWDDSRGVDSGRTFGSSQSESVQPHTHDVATSAGTGLVATGGTNAYSKPSGTTTSTSYGTTETRPRNIALLYCIRY